MTKQYTILTMLENIIYNISDVIVNYEEDYQLADESLDDYMDENFNWYYLESSNEWVVAFDCEVLIEGLENERQAMDMFYFLENASYKKANEIKGDK